MNKLVTQEQQQVFAIVGATLTFLHGLQECLAPEKHLAMYCTEKYKYKDENYEEYVMSVLRQDGLAILTSPLVWFLMTFKELSYQQAIGIALLPWIILMLYFFLNEVPQKVGGSLKGTLLNILVFSFVAFSNIFETTYGDLSVKILAGFGLTHGLLVFFSPNLHASLLGNVQDDDILQFARRGVGASLLTTNIYFAALIGGVENPMACGIGWWVGLFTMLILLDDFKKYKTDLPKLYAWFVIMAFFGVVLTIQYPVEEVEETE